MHRSLQSHILTWFAALATIAAVGSPTLDHALFAAVLLLATVLGNTREHLTARRGKLRVIVGGALAVAVAWGAVVLRMQPLAVDVPARVTVGVLVLAATLPSIALILHTLVAARARWLRRPLRDLEDLEDLD